MFIYRLVITRDMKGECLGCGRTFDHEKGTCPYCGWDREAWRQGGRYRLGRSGLGRWC